MTVGHVAGALMMLKYKLSSYLLTKRCHLWKDGNLLLVTAWNRCNFAVLHAGSIRRRRATFRPSFELSSMRQIRQNTGALEQRKQLSLRIRKLQQREIRNWKSQQLFLKLSATSQWKSLKTMVATLHGHSLTQQPSPNDFADMLENSFCGAVAPPKPQILMSEPPALYNARVETRAGTVENQQILTNLVMRQVWLLN